MRLVLLCGGSGTRLRPLSNDIRSKLFLDLLPAPGGGRESMVRRLCRQLEEAGMLSSALFVIRRDQTALLRRRIGGSGLVIPEPGRRGTYMAAALAAAYLHSVLSADPDEIVCVMPADPLVDETFFRTIARLPDALEQTGAKLALIGTVPSHPSDQFGYIVPEGAVPSGGHAAVRRFAEKPAASDAEKLIRDGALWNCGVFAFRLKYLLASMAERELPADYGSLQELYGRREADCFDREIAEREPEAIVLRHDGLWRDLGSWSSLSDHLGTSVVGPGAIIGDARGSHIVNELHIPIHVIGVSGIIAAAGPDGILVLGKSQSSRVRDLPPHAGRPMYGEYAWGVRRVIHADAPDSGGRTIALASLTPGAVRQMPEEPGGDTLITVLSGEGTLLRLDGSLKPLRRGETVLLARGERYALQTDSGMELIEVHNGEPAHMLEQDDANEPG
ncbi:mannose-1-phosphate guanylyltransferase [Thermobacillus composti KWC4]|uniref:Mannose-1-phosphate guanylyltransferase n=1 Tax=Thermobacillus composti (strain DSM 18247 / JCM 13945 / KWC4) TaxID=717605 RepID=L0EGP7_THECK|nr:sugar phosphate nucleotidyltransferase [Thermobacillus composti]AGA58846.1 mannose-1-phosphate guanylyltransferase [Thermobacillus composti KWC4]